MIQQFSRSKPVDEELWQTLREQLYYVQSEFDDDKGYEALIRRKVPSLHFDLLMLGIGEDGHTASLFPHTHGLYTKDRLVTANYVPQMHTWRITMTYECIHMARYICIYALGAKKASMASDVLVGPYDPYQFPVQRVGTSTHKAM